MLSESRHQGNLMEGWTKGNLPSQSCCRVDKNLPLEKPSEAESQGKIYPGSPWLTPSSLLL